MIDSDGRSRELLIDGSVSRLTVVEARAEVADVLAGWVRDREVFVVSAEPIWQLHADATLAALERAAAGWTPLLVPDGEDAKTLEVAESLWRSLLEAGGRRDSLVLTFGGGAVCDLGAFVAATFMRGLSFSHVPTTLLAQVDAAIGGKSAINLGGAKNMVGAFRHPDHVVAATELLATLPARQLRSGLVEAIKMGVLCDVELFELIEERASGLLGAPTSSHWSSVVAGAQRAKARVVGDDPLEAGGRRVLNFGHTLGHALEAALGYRELTHGEAVAHGMRFALRLALDRGLDPAVADRLEGLLTQLDLPVLPTLQVESLLDSIGRDKKARASGVVWVLPTALGRWEAVTLERGLVARELERFLASHRDAC